MLIPSSGGSNPNPFTLPNPASTKLPASGASDLIQEKHHEYLRQCHFHRWLYYTTRIVAGLAAGLLPFVVSGYPTVATVLAILIVIATVIDYAVDPRGNWQTYSKATDLLAIAELKARGEYDRYKEQLEILLATETHRLNRLVDLEDMLNKVRETKASG